MVLIVWKGFHAGTNIALDLDERTMLKGPLFPRYVLNFKNVLGVLNGPLRHRRRRRRRRRADTPRLAGLMDSSPQT